MIHPPSLGLGAVIATIAIIASFTVFNVTNMQQQQELQFLPTPSITPPSSSADGIAQQPPSGTILKTTFLENSSPILGDPNAPVTIVEFGDYQCHFCNVFFHETEHKILENYIQTGKVKMIFKDFTIIGPDSKSAANAAHCAQDQNKFWEYHDILYNNWTGENNGWASSPNLLKFAKDIDLDIDEFTECMTDNRHLNIVESSNADANMLGLTGTPAFFVISPDDKVVKITGAQPYEVFVQVIESMQMPSS